jgi:predicted enzyme related to lactoylglutathione lyase
MAKIPTGRFVWFEYVTHQAREAQGFFGELFGWKTRIASVPGDGTYTMIMLRDATIGGYAEPPPKDTHWLSYLQVADVNATAAKVKSLGGTIEEPPFAVDGMATMARVKDPAGVSFALWQPNQVDNDGDYRGIEGSWVWNELYSDDIDESLEFYRAIAGFEVETMRTDDGPGPGRYEILKSDGKGRGGVMKMAGVRPQWMPYVQVANADSTAERAKRLGADIKNLETIPDVGRIAVFIDPFGALLGVLEPTPKKPPERR